MSKPIYHQPSLTLVQQIALLKEKGLVIADTRSAEHWLSHISYFRFKNYSYKFKDYKEGDGNYLTGTTFEQVRDLYLFDRKLKVMVFEALESIEVAIKTQFTNAMAAPYGAHWYTDPKYFFSEQERRQLVRNAMADDIVKGLDHAAFLEEIADYMDDPDETFLQSYKKVYDPVYPPSWMLVEIITFGRLSILIDNLKPCDEKTSIHEHFNLPKKHFMSWLHCFSFIRNKCAHHSRLVYSKINFAPAMPQKRSRQFLRAADRVSHDTLYAVLACIQYLLSVCNSHSAFKDQIRALVAKFPDIDYNALGFTVDWLDEPLWN